MQTAELFLITRSRDLEIYDYRIVGPTPNYLYDV